MIDLHGFASLITNYSEDVVFMSLSDFFFFSLEGGYEINHVGRYNDKRMQSNNIKTEKH